jgi:hypothetical protein
MNEHLQEHIPGREKAAAGVIHDASTRLAFAYAAGQNRFMHLLTTEHDSTAEVISSQARDAAWARDFAMEGWKPGYDAGPPDLGSLERFAEIAGAWSHVDTTVARAVDRVDAYSREAVDPMLPNPLSASAPTIRDAAALSAEGQMGPGRADMDWAMDRYARTQLELFTDRARELQIDRPLATGRAPSAETTRGNTQTRLDRSITARAERMQTTVPTHNPTPFSRAAAANPHPTSRGCAVDRAAHPLPLKS